MSSKTKMQRLQELLSRTAGRRPAFQISEPVLHVGNALRELQTFQMAQRRQAGKYASFSPYSAKRWRAISAGIQIVPSHEPNPHIVVVGMSGTGKSSLLKSFLSDIRASGMNAIVFDAHNEFEGVVRSIGGTVYDAKSSGLNIFALDGMSREERIAELASLFRGVYGLGYIQTTKLMECMRYAYRKAQSATALRDGVPNMELLIRELDIFMCNAKYASERHVLAHLRSRLALLNSPALNSGFVDASSLMHGIHSFSIASIRSEEARYIYVHELLARAYALMRSNEKEHGVHTFIMIDEAQTLLDRAYGESSMVRRLVEEGRKYGIGIIVSTPSISSLPKQMAANSSNIIVLKTLEPKDASYAANLLSKGDTGTAEELRKAICALGQNEAIMLASGRPVAVATPRAAIASKQHPQAKPWDLPRHPVQRQVLEGSVGARAVDDALASGALEELKPACSLSGESWLMRRNPSLSIEHEVMVMRISAELHISGVFNYIMDNSIGPDIVVRAAGGRIAVEYETGRKSIRSTAAMLKAREAKYDAIILIVNESAFGFYRSNFAGGKVSVLSSSDVKLVAGAVKEAAAKFCSKGEATSVPH